jgi:hypothetical protein
VHRGRHARDLAELAEAFEPRVWLRGRAYWLASHVLELKEDPDALEVLARVRGRAEASYRVWLMLGSDDEEALVDSGCECPALNPCKHVAAVAWALGSAEVPSPEPRDPVVEVIRAPYGRPDVPEAPPPGSSSDLERWAAGLHELARASAARRESSTPRTPRDSLLFLLKPPRPRAGRPGIQVEAWQVKRQPNGSWGDARTYDLERASLSGQAARPRWLDPADIALWYRLQGISRAHNDFAYTPIIPPTAEGLELLRDLVKTERCRFEVLTGPAMRWGTSRTGRLTWRVDGDGAQSLQVEVEGDASLPVLALAPPVFVDSNTGECGTVTMDVAPDLLPRLLGAPRVSVKHARALPPTMREVIESHALPAPRPITVKRHRAGKPTPKVRLAAFEGERPRGTLTFVYDGVEIDPAGTGAYAARLDGDVLHQVHRDRAAEAEAALVLARAGGELVLEGARVRLQLRSKDAWLDFCRLVVPKLRLEGWVIDSDEDWAWDIVDPDAWYVEQFDDGAGTEGGDWFLLELGVEIEGERVNILPAVVRAIASGDIERHRLRAPSEPFALQLDRRTILVPAERLQKIVDVLVELHADKALTGDRVRIPGISSARLLELEDFTWTGSGKLRALAEELARLREPPSAEPPAALRATLREYQRRGLGWLRTLADAGLGGILADDMGLGKTVQALAHVLAEIDAGRAREPSLVVAPRSVLHNWAREAERFAPTLRVGIFHGTERGPLLQGDHDLVITTYALLQRDPSITEREWHVVVLDEAQGIKNARTKVAAAARKLRAHQRLCLTGTPMENDLGELWSLVHFVAPGLLGSPREFKQVFRNPIERDGDARRMAALSRRIAPFMLRRTKSAVLTELPPKTEIVRHAVLEGKQRDLYESVRLTMAKRVRDELRRRGLAQSRIVVLDALLKLRQVCCHPPLVRTESAAAVSASAKLELLFELLDELRAEGRSVLVFSQFTSMLAVIGEGLTSRGIGYLEITGKTRKRQEIVDRFQAGEVHVMLVSLKAGGTGLNLTAADTVIHYDPWWNPAVERQASDRAHRIGQTRPVTVYRLVCEGTVEERMLALHERKLSLSEAIAQGAERRSLEGLTLDEADLATLFAPAG